MTDIEQIKKELIVILELLNSTLYSLVVEQRYVCQIEGVWI